MLTLCHGPDLTELADHLLDTLRENPLQNPMAPERFVVTNDGMKKWLSTYGAQEEGIVANWEFFFVAEQMWKLIRMMDDDIPEVLPSECDPMTWSLMRVLEQHPEDPKLGQLHRYVYDIDPEVQMYRSWKLCRVIARTFDQYLIYRPDMIIGWEEGRRMTKHVSEPWQMHLWKLLTDYWGQVHADEKWIHRAQIHQELVETIDSGEMWSRSKLPERIIIFGVPTMPPPYIQTFVKLSRQIDVCVYMLDDLYFHSENALVTSMGKEGEDYDFYFRKYIEEDEEVRKNLNTYQFSYKEDPPTGVLLLDHIRRDLVQPEKENPPPIQGDRSVQVHSCHSALREVEVLHDQLLALLDENTSLTPSDILIMAPNMEIYAPAIDAVFGTPEQSLPDIPYSILDRGATVCGPLTDAFIKLMRLPGSRFKATQVLEFLGLEPIRAAFELTDEDLNKLERWIRENRIRWGINGKWKEAFELPKTRRFTWSAGLNRMMLGYAMKEEDDHLYEGIYPYPEVESLDDAELMGTLSKIMHSLFEFHQRADKEHTLDDWSRHLRMLADRFMPDEKKWLRELSQLRDQVEQLAEQQELAGFAKKVPYRIVRSYLDQNLSEQNENGGLIGRGITFSSLAPMRSIPFKVIGMIGMNDGAFPCPEVPVEFDLMGKEPRRGDRSRREGERHQFLENILSAGKVLYLSYVGQSNRQDAEFAPSVVIQEFLDYLENRFGVPAETLITKHRLQAFSPLYFTDEGKEKGLFSYSKLQEEIVKGLASRQDKTKTFISDSLPEPDEERRSLSVRELVQFYQHPARFLMRNRLGVYLEEEQVSTEDREPFFLGGLEGYQLGQEMLKRYMKGRDPASFRAIAMATDMLPQGWPGEESFQATLEEVRQFGADLQQAFEQEELESAEVNLRIEEFRLTGRLTDLYESGRVDYRYGSARSKDLIDLWIQHLVLQVVNPVGQKGHSRLFTLDKKQGLVDHVLDPISADEAHAYLIELLKNYWQGLMQPFPFFANTSYTYAEAVIKKDKDHEEAVKAAYRKWMGSYGYSFEGEDAYNHRIFGHSNPLELEAFKTLAVSFWKPFFEILGEEGA